MNFNIIANYFNKERENWILWIPVFFAIGIYIYFAINFEPSKNLIIKMIFSSFFLLLFSIKYRKFLFISIIIFTICLGFLNAKFRTYNQSSPKIIEQIHNANIIGRVDNIYNGQNGTKIILDNVIIDKLASDKTPHKIRLNIKANIDGLNIGDEISLKAFISPLPRAVINSAYDFAFFAYFQQIGAIAYGANNIEIVKKADINIFTIKLYNLRKNIAQYINSKIDKDSASIANALLLGDKSYIIEENLANIRDAGIAHLLAISGMHIVLVTGFFFMISRYMMLLSIRFSNKYNVKKISAVIAIIMGFLYLLITAMPISAIRAYIMVAFFFIAILIDRNSTPLRSVAFAALVILLILPESLLSPSFQMSFAAVIGLISTFEYLNPYLQNISKINKYIYSLFLSSIIATMATMPFAIYHFNHYSLYSLLSNLAAVPITLFIIMPFGILFLLLYFLNFGDFALNIMSFFIKIILKMAEFIANLPFSSGVVLPLSNIALGIIIFAALWLFLWKEKWRIYGVYIIFIVFILDKLIFKSADIIISADKKNYFAVKNAKNQLIFSNQSRDSYEKDVWLKKTASEIQQENFTNSDIIKCNKYQCKYYKNNYITFFVKRASALKNICYKAHIIVNFTWKKVNCTNDAIVINKQNLKYNGTYSIYLGKNITIKTAYNNNNRIF